MSDFDDYGTISKGSRSQMAFKAFTKLHAIFGFDLEVEKSGYGIEIEFLGATVRFGRTEGFPDAQLFLDF